MNMRFTHARRWTRMYMPKYHRRRCVLAKMWIRLMCLQKRACACCYWRVCVSFLLGFPTCKFTVFIDTIQSIYCHKFGSFVFAVITTCSWRRRMPWPQLHQITTRIIMHGGDSIYSCLRCFIIFLFPISLSLFLTNSLSHALYSSLSMFFKWVGKRMCTRSENTLR